MTRANEKRRERLLRLLEGRTQRDPLWSARELAEALSCSPRTAERELGALMDEGLVAPRRPRKVGGSTAT